ncbi:hypothetical protein [Terasakiella pusilla]|uniref:hypothetical protein n=1 Tax=Terasakiella pusilla TaxID=64973 RepID=UPI003AA960ED
MSTLGSAQLSPRVISAYERLEKAVSRLQQVGEAQKGKVDAEVVMRLQNQIDGLKEDNLALSEALSAHSEADYDNQLEKLSDKLDNLQTEKEALDEEKAALSEEKMALSAENDRLKSLNSDFSARLERLIGNVQQILEED